MLLHRSGPPFYFPGRPPEIRTAFKNMLARRQKLAEQLENAGTGERVQIICEFARIKLVLDFLDDGEASARGGQDRDGG